MTITAKYPSRCSCCGGAIKTGEQIEWSKGQPVCGRNMYTCGHCIGW